MLDTIINGRLTKEPELVAVEKGQIVNIRVAQNRAGKQTEFFNIKLWNRVAASFQRTAHKGDLVRFVCGMRPNRFYSPKQKRYLHEMILTCREYQVIR